MILPIEDFGYVIHVEMLSTLDTRKQERYRGIMTRAMLLNPRLHPNGDMELVELLNHPYVGDFLTYAKLIPSGCVHNAVTSPPYWGGVRDYDVEPTIWAPLWTEDSEWEDCEHE